MHEASETTKTSEGTTTPSGRSRKVDFSDYPRGWFRVAFSEDVAPGAVKTVHYFGRDLVLFRGEDGALSIVGPHCPHLGAHLGHGGKVVDNRLICPFHGWAFDAKGELAHVPLAKKLPKRACLETWSVEEKHGIVFVHFHYDGKPPTYPVPEIPLFSDPRWGEPTRFRKVFRSTIYDLSENAVDRAHFGVVHGRACPSTETAHMAQIEMEERGSVLHIHTTYPILVGPIRLEGKLDIHWLDTVISCIVGEGGITYGLAALPTPIDRDTVENVYVLFTLRRPRPLAWLENRAMTALLSSELENDRSIWENKRFVEHPILSDFDGPIIKFRKWLSRFYPERATHDRHAEA